MNIHGVDHIEFYVGDAPQAAFLLRSAYGFELCGHSQPDVGRAGQRSLLLRHGEVTIMLTTGLVPGHPAAEYVSKHGDGVAVIAFGVADATTAFNTAVARGARIMERPRVHKRGDTTVVTASVSGFGDVIHRLVERHGAAEAFMPGLITMLTPDIAMDEPMFSMVDHTAVCVPAGALPATTEYYRTVFGFESIFEEVIEVGEQAMASTVVQSPSGEITFTLIEPVTGRKPGQIDEFLAHHGGAGVQHLALLTDDIIAAVRLLRDRGVHFLNTPDCYYDALAARIGGTDVRVKELRETNVLVDHDHWGQLFQIFAQSLHVRDTFFFELIERHGARTFGSGNVKALYEAINRERANA